MTGTVHPQPLSAQAHRDSSKTSPHGHVRASVPRASASHSSALGRRTGRSSASAAHAQNASASARVRSVAGWSASCASSRFAVSGPPVASVNALSWALTTGQRPTSSDSSTTTRSSPGSPST